MKVLDVVIIDDEPKAIELLQKYCDKSEMANVIATFREPIKAISFLNTTTADLLLLDINMPNLSGLEFLDTLQSKPKVIFTTAYSKYALDSYDYEAVDYLLKPITFQRFLKALSKCMPTNVEIAGLQNENLKSSSQNIFVKSGSQFHKLNIDEILYLEKDGNYLIFHLPEKKILSRQNMKDVFDLLDESQFLRVHKSFIVAVDKIKIVESTQLIVDGKVIPIGRKFRENVIRLLDIN